MSSIALNLPLPVGMLWYKHFTNSLKQYASFCDLYISLTGIIEDIISPNNELSENFSYLCDQLYEGFLSSLNTDAITKQQADMMSDNFTEFLDTLFWEFKSYYLPYLASVDVSTDNETGFLNVRVRDIFDTFITVEIDGAVYAPIPILRNTHHHQPVSSHGTTIKSL